MDEMINKLCAVYGLTPQYKDCRYMVAEFPELLNTFFEGGDYLYSGCLSQNRPYVALKLQAYALQSKRDVEYADICRPMVFTAHQRYGDNINYWVCCRTGAVGTRMDVLNSLLCWRPVQLC